VNPLLHHIADAVKLHVPDFPINEFELTAYLRDALEWGKPEDAASYVINKMLEEHRRKREDELRKEYMLLGQKVRKTLKRRLRKL
jgi:hypothetical protein